MTDLSLNRIGDLLRSVIELLWAKPDGLSAREILAFLPEMTALTEYEAGYPPASNIPRYERIIRLATIPMVRAGWLIKSNKGRWLLTEAGRKACRKYPSAQELYTEANRILEAGKKRLPAAWMAYEEAQESAWEQVQKYLKDRNPDDFQTIVVELLKAMGYHIFWIAPPGKSGGQVDLVAHVDPMGAKGGRILVQINQWEQAVDLDNVNSFATLLGEKDNGLLISISGFTNEVKGRLEVDVINKMTLLDLEAFFDLWISHYDQLSDKARTYLPLKPVQFLHGME